MAVWFGHGPPKDSGPAHHERGGADDWLGGLGEWGSWVRPERCLPLGPGWEDAGMTGRSGR